MQINDTGTAVFKVEPTTIEDLVMPIRRAGMFRFVVKHIEVLGQMAFENFAADMTVWREFIDKYPESKINEQGIFEVIYVTTKDSDRGVLVAADGKDFPQWCALWPMPKYEKES